MPLTGASGGAGLHHGRHRNQRLEDRRSYNPKCTWSDKMGSVTRVFASKADAERVIEYLRLKGHPASLVTGNAAAVEIKGEQPLEFYERELIAAGGRDAEEIIRRAKSAAGARADRDTVSEPLKGEPPRS
jgi:hypothetical protein